ncbi:hypothetical protein QRD02_01275 [Aequorivita sp. SDUM287046]|uniref:T9SS type A sorting domain-containing protein n=1 Tax=Aequorivita aurantiaca TaxID=3053356 RepID=A0ABT8DEQ2_9FLAO|nr:hypothetical protein [Aequorivita aurantiaca]MDN3722999.1 hypothetical protein [Aequorivita aurantiaca]
MNAQQGSPVCATPEPTIPDPTGVYSHSTDSAYFDMECEPIVLNIYFWGIKHPDGVDYFPDQAHNVLTAVANTNILYNQFNIYFKYRGFEKIQSPALPNDPDGHFVLENIIQFNGLTSWAEANGYKKADAFNVYVFGWGAFGGISPGYNVTTSGVSAAGLTLSTMTHEIGHNLNLIHTRSARGIGGERVTRDINDPDYNADTHGDRVIDTAANPGYRASNGTYPFITVNCTYENDGTQRDYDGDEYIPSHEDVINVLSDAYICMDGYSPLTIGQGIRAREALEDDILGNFAPTLTSIESLYEPYAGEYFVSSSPGTPVLYKPLFQPGFDYRFVECSCDCPEPADYNDISFSYTNNSLLTISKYEPNYSIITHPNHSAIYIDLDICDTYGQNTRRCYDNYNRRPNGGSVTLFNDGVLNANVTITPKDSIGINNPNLIDELDAGLYKIEFNYEEGATQQTIIFKQN